MGKQKGLKDAIILTMIVLTISAFSLFISNIVLFNTPNKSQKKESNAADVTISNYDELKAFADNVTAGTTYEGQTIQLKAHIDCSWNNIVIGRTESHYHLGFIERTPRPFKGIFDGNGFSIYNVSYIANSRAIQHGLFQQNEGTIKNLKVNAFRVSISYIDNTHTLAGVISGTNNGIIRNCMVENIEFISQKPANLCYVAPLAGVNNGTIKECMATASYICSGTDEKTGMIARSFVAYAENVGTLEYCVSAVSTPPTWDNQGSNCFLSCGEAWGAGFGDTADIIGWDPDTHTSSAYYRFEQHTHGVYGIPYWTSTGEGNEQRYLCVYLKRFMTFQTFNFAAAEGGYVTPTSVKVPWDYQMITESGNTANLYGGQVVTAVPYQGYEFSHWDMTIGTAYFKLKTYKIWFNEGINTSQEPPEGIECELGRQYTVEHGTKIEITPIKFPNKSITHCYQKIKFSFVDIEEKKREMIYKPKAGYYIDYYSICDDDNPGQTLYWVYKGGDIDVTTILKSYEIVFA